MSIRKRNTRWQVCVENPDELGRRHRVFATCDTELSTIQPPLTCS